jgi:hypothetical protein
MPRTAAAASSSSDSASSAHPTVPPNSERIVMAPAAALLALAHLAVRVIGAQRGVLKVNGTQARTCWLAC